MSFLALFASAIASLVGYQWLMFQITKWKVRDIPTIGGDGFISHYLTARKFAEHGRHMIEEGYAKYPGQAFKIATLETNNRWLIVCNGPSMLDDIRKSTQEHLSFGDASLELLQMDHTIGHPKMHDEYHADVVRGPLTRGFPSRFDDIKDEIQASFKDIIPVKDEWTSYPLFATLIPIICRTTNRLFVGLPLCRNPEWIRIHSNLTVNIFHGGQMLNEIPAILRPFVGRWITAYHKEARLVKEFLTPLVAERMQQDEQHGKKYEGRPNDLISWLLDTAPAKLRTLHDFVFRVILINFASIHTTTSTLSNILFDLAPRPEYIEPLREEVEEIINEHGWTKEAMGRMRKLDSFMRESSRYGGIGAASVTRHVRKDFKFSNGFVAPKGFRLVVPTSPLHLDPAVYADAQTFKGFRFSEMRDGDDQMGALKHQMVQPEPNFLFFGYGRAACPGRFFAVNEIKAMLAYILINYDFRLADGAKDTPPPHWSGVGRSPNAFARVEFRKRQKA
ncbi:cytochrome P450 [Coprinopsis sp. MPI-PUGE-AT-0042]|nr:cytochrome P450 [Coprinopsis sp. MPI-PUGE-AT-0042]